MKRRKILPIILPIKTIESTVPKLKEHSPRKDSLSSSFSAKGCLTPEKVPINPKVKKQGRIVAQNVRHVIMLNIITDNVSKNERYQECMKKNP